MKTVFLDIETSDWFDSPRLQHLPRDEQVHHMPFGLAVTITSDRDIWYWDSADELLDYLDMSRVVTWNGNDFDIPIIERAAGRKGYEIQKLDLFAAIRDATGRWYSLNTVSLANGLGKKTAAGAQAAKWIASGEPELMKQAFEYCEQDVLLLIRIAEKLHINGIVLPARPHRNEHTALHVRYNGDGLEVSEC